MTALAVLHSGGGSPSDADLRPLPWRRMVWVTWRQHRAALTGVAALFLTLALLLWVGGLQLHHAYVAATTCHPLGSFACGQLENAFNGTNGFLANGLLLQAMPALVGAFLGAPVLAREFETGTFRYTWTQGFGRWRWTLAKLVSLAIVVAIAAGIIGVLASWYYGPYFGANNEALSLQSASPFAPGLFDVSGLVFASWTLLAFATGALAGAVIRRVVPAIAATLAVYGGLNVATVIYFRRHYLAPLVTTRLNLPSSVWVIAQQWLTKGGQPASAAQLGQVLQGAPGGFPGKGGVPKSLDAWQYLAHHGFTLSTTYQPASRFWSFQWIEACWLLALSALLAFVAAQLVRRRAI